METTNIKVQRNDHFATFEMENGIGVAIDFSLEDSLNGRYMFKTTNMKCGTLEPNKELLTNDEMLIETVTEHFDKFLNFKKGIRYDSRIDKFQWFIKSRINLYTNDNHSETIRSVLFYALKTIKLEKDTNNSLLFSIDDIDNCIMSVLSQNSLINNKRLIS